MIINSGQCEDSIHTIIIASSLSLQMPLMKFSRKIMPLSFAGMSFHSSDLPQSINRMIASKRRTAVAGSGLSSSYRATSPFMTQTLSRGEFDVFAPHRQHSEENAPNSDIKCRANDVPAFLSLPYERVQHDFLR